MSRPVVRLSVRAVVETTHHDSDLSPAAGAAQRMREGAIAHRARQSAGHGLDDTYQHEVALSADYEGEALLLHVAGRADAIFMRDGMHVIEEIKLGTQDVPLVPAHMAQAAMYGHMLCRRNALAGVCLRVVYVDLQGNVIACYEQERAAEALAAEFEEEAERREHYPSIFTSELKMSTGPVRESHEKLDELYRWDYQYTASEFNRVYFGRMGSKVFKLSTILPDSEAALELMIGKLEAVP